MAMLKALQKGRSERKASKKDKLRKSIQDSEEEDDVSAGEFSLEDVARPFSDENQSWLTPAKSTIRGTDKKKTQTKETVSVKKTNLLDGGSDGNSSEEEEEGKSIIIRCNY